MKNTPAFPIQHQIIDANDINFKLGDSGMSLRDYFAAKAMGEMLKRCNEITTIYLDVSAHQAYAAADAMMKARGE